MKTAAIQQLRLKLQADGPVFGLWVSLDAPAITEMAVALGVDWVVIDTEHGHLDWQEVVAHIRAAVRSQTAVLVRIVELNAGLIKRGLDLGADGVVIPWIETAEQLRQAISYARYPLQGVRGIGADRATVWGQCLKEHTAEANEHVLVVPILETVRAFSEVPAMCKVEGSEIFFFGPADYSASAGYRGEWEGPGIAQQLLQMKDTIRSAGKNCGILAAGNDDLLRRREQGFRVLGLGLDVGLFLRSLRTSLAVVGRDQPMHTSLDAAAGESLPARRFPPESMRPDRLETVILAGARPTVEIDPGVHVDAHVGGHNQARNLTAGIVTFDPGSILPYHTHPFTEAITLLRGRGQIEVEGRCYDLDVFDNVVIPPQTAHQTRNLSAHDPAIFHIAMSADKLVRTPVESKWRTQLMPTTSTGTPGKERVNRFRWARRAQPSANVETIEYYNAELVSELTISGGYALFHPGGRQLAHVHDFDESICIIDGEATCVVEGRHYTVTHASTVFVPRGRVHYFKNESNAPLTMLWVDVGPAPTQIVVDETCATERGNPWQQEGTRR